MADLESDSAPIVLPMETDSVLVSLTCEYELDGWFSTGEAYATVSAKAYLDGVAYTVLFDSDSWGFPARDGIDNLASYSVAFPASAGQEITFLFRASASAFGGGASVDWTISLLQVTVSGPMALQGQTWAEIKSCF
ncbi:MAG: hypothetical protein QUS11_01185 [Candidatus Fermentibacter sp.]|nr:hypothetical protein [Candidatus Fermentibacter sp.]